MAWDSVSSSLRSNSSLSISSYHWKYWLANNCPHVTPYVLLWIKGPSSFQKPNCLPIFRIHSLGPNNYKALAVPTTGDRGHWSQHDCHLKRTVIWQVRASKLIWAGVLDKISHLQCATPAVVSPNQSSRNQKSGVLTSAISVNHEKERCLWLQWQKTQTRPIRGLQVLKQGLNIHKASPSAGPSLNCSWPRNMVVLPSPTSLVLSHCFTAGRCGLER